MALCQLFSFYDPTWATDYPKNTCPGASVEKPVLMNEYGAFWVGTVDWTQTPPLATVDPYPFSFTSQHVWPWRTESCSGSDGALKVDGWLYWSWILPPAQPRGHQRDEVGRVDGPLPGVPARYSRTASSSNGPTNQRAVISKSPDTPILSSVALPARRRGACPLRDTRIRSR